MLIPITNNLIEIIKRYTYLISYDYQLNSTEQKVLTKLLLKYIVLMQRTKSSDLLFKKDSLKEIKTSLKLQDQVFNNIRMSLRKKKALVNKGEDTKISESILNFLPKSKEHEITFKFIIQ